MAQVRAPPPFGGGISWGGLPACPPPLAAPNVPAGPAGFKLTVYPAYKSEPSIKMKPEVSDCWLGTHTNTTPEASSTRTCGGRTPGSRLLATKQPLAHGPPSHDASGRLPSHQLPPPLLLPPLPPLPLLSASLAAATAAGSRPRADGAVGRHRAQTESGGGAAHGGTPVPTQPLCRCCWPSTASCWSRTGRRHRRMSGSLQQQPPRRRKPPSSRPSPVLLPSCPPSPRPPPHPPLAIFLLSQLSPS